MHDSINVSSIDSTTERLRGSQLSGAHQRPLAYRANLCISLGGKNRDLLCGKPSRLFLPWVLQWAKRTLISSIFTKTAEEGVTAVFWGSAPFSGVKPVFTLLYCFTPPSSSYGSPVHVQRSKVRLPTHIR